MEISSKLDKGMSLVFSTSANTTETMTVSVLFTVVFPVSAKNFVDKTGVFVVEERYNDQFGETLCANDLHHFIQ